MPDALGSAESTLKQPVSKTRVEPDFRHLLKIPPSCRSSPCDPRHPPLGATPPSSVSPTLPDSVVCSAFSGSRTFSPAAAPRPAHNSFLSRSTRSLGRAQSSLMSGATAAVLGSVSARTAAGLTQLHSSVSSYIPLKGPLRDQISPGARPPPFAHAAAPRPPPPCPAHRSCAGYCIKAGGGFYFGTQTQSCAHLRVLVEISTLFPNKKAEMCF